MLVSTLMTKTSVRNAAVASTPLSCHGWHHQKQTRASSFGNHDLYITSVSDDSPYRSSGLASDTP